MCMRCDGYSEDDVLRAIDLNVRVHGFHINAVQDRRPWTYTIGVTDSTGHPDLVITDMGMQAAGQLLWWVYRQIDSSGSVDTAMLSAHGVRLGRVEHRYLDGKWFGDWVRRYGRLPRVGEFLQVHPPPDVFCSSHRNYRLLDRAR